MKNTALFLFIFAFVSMLTSCELAGDIFKGGFYLGIIAVFIVVGLIIWLLRKFR